MAQKPKSSWDREMTHQTSHRWPCRYCGGSQAPKQCPAYGKTCARCGKMGHLRKVCRSKRDHVVHEVEREMVQEPQEEEIETVSINSVYLNKNQLLITVHLEMQVGKTTVEIPYKISISSEGNVMPLYIFKKLFKNITEEQLKRSLKGNIKLKTYNRTYIMQLGTCTVLVKFKNFKK